MLWVFLIVALAIFIFGSVLLFGAPYLPTLKAQTLTALELLALKPGQTLLELGSGDGRVLKAAAKQGVYAVGYEINPLLVLFSKINTWHYRQMVTVHWRNYWRVSLPPADGIYVFLLQRYMQKLDDKLGHDFPNGIRLVSFAFAFPNHQPAATRGGVMLYELKPDAS